jgi:hypothetical protein
VELEDLFGTGCRLIDKFLNVFLNDDLGLLGERFFDYLRIRESNVRERLRHSIFFDKSLRETFNTVKAFGRETGNWELHKLLNSSTS